MRPSVDHFWTWAPACLIMEAAGAHLLRGRTLDAPPSWVGLLLLALGVTAIVLLALAAASLFGRQEPLDERI